MALKIYSLAYGFLFFVAVLQILDIFVWIRIRIRGSRRPKTCGSGGSGSATVCNYFFCSALLNSYKMQGLTRTWSEPIVCSRITGRLVTTFLRVPDRLLITLEPGETRVIDRVEAGLEKTRVFLKNPAQWVFCFFWVFWFFGFFLNIFAQKGEFLGFFQFQEYF